MENGRLIRLVAGFRLLSFEEYVLIAQDETLRLGRLAELYFEAAA